MDPVNQTYKVGFFKNRYRLSWRAPIVVEALEQTFDLKPPDSVIDVGCAIGDYVFELENRGYTAWGIEGSEAAREFFVTNKISVWDLRTPLNMGPCPSKYNVAFSLEVAEHIDPFHAPTYVHNLTKLSDTILISAASPGQKGHGHVNCQPRQYWIDLFREENFVNFIGYEKRWREFLALYRTKKELSSYYKNVICFRRLK